MAGSDIDRGADPANQPGGTLTTTYTYDWMKHLTGVSMPRGSVTQTRSFAYDGSGRLTSATNPENGTVLYYYNADNTLWYKHDAKGQDAVYSYDAAKRVTEIQRYPTGKSNAEDVCRRVTYTYDTNPVSSGFSHYSAGRLTTSQYAVCTSGTLASSGSPPSLSGPGGSVTEMYSYHPAGAVTAKQMRVLRSGTDVDGNPGAGYATVEADYTYGGTGQMATFQLVENGVASGALTYSYDSMARPSGLTTPFLNPCTVNTGPESIVQNVSYDYAGRMTSMQYKTGQTTSGAYAYIDACGGWGYYTQYNDSYTTESKGYNVNGQMTSLGWSGGITGTLTYSYSATANNGQVTGVTDSVSGETISYQYDLLKRLTSASSTPSSGTTPAAWTQTYGFDGFGNLTSKVLNGTATTIGVNGATNQLSSALYDGNVNMTSGAGLTMGYDEANRMVSATPTSGGTEYYGYAPDNKRIYRLTAAGVEEWTFYGAQGERLLSNMQMTGLNETGTGWSCSFSGGVSYVWFAGKMLSEGGNAVYSDRLGTNRAGGARFLPFGEEITGTGNDRVKFGTYTRDGFTGLDYADQRFYASGYGRFSSPDPYQAAAKGANNTSTPSSWNRYEYVLGDPINGFDPQGLFLLAPDPIDNCPPGTVLYNGSCVAAVNDGSGKGLPNGGGPGGSSAPPCPPTTSVNGLPGGSAEAQIAQNVALAQQQSATFMSEATAAASADPGAVNAGSLYLTWMAQWLTSQFRNKGQWDYKRDPGVTSQNPGGYQQVVNFGNFNFGAVMEGLGLSYYEAQNAAGIYQTYLGTNNQGFPLFQWPYGDSKQDALVIQQGYNYEKAVQSGCK